MSDFIARSRDANSHRTPWNLPARRPYVFWISAVVVLVVGSALALRNYVDAGAMAAARVSGANELAVGETAQPAVAADLRLPKFCLSMAIVFVASIVAGFSVAHLLRRPTVGFRTMEEVQSFLPAPVMATVPVQSLLR